MMPEDMEKLPKESTKSIVTKLVIVPLAIVAVAVSIFLFFGWLTYDHKSSEEFVADIKTASASVTKVIRPVTPSSSTMCNGELCAFPMTLTLFCGFAVSGYE